MWRLGQGTGIVLAVGGLEGGRQELVMDSVWKAREKEGSMVDAQVPGLENWAGEAAAGGRGPEGLRQGRLPEAQACLDGGLQRRW